MGFRYFVSIGSMLDVDFGDLIDYLGNDPEVNSILLYIESLTEIRNFMSAARSVSRIKPIVVLKAGESRSGAKAAASHTGAMAGEDRIYEEAFRRSGIARVRTLEDFFDCAELLAKQTPPSGRRLVVITNAGGPGVMAADAIEKYGLELGTLEENTLSKLNKVLPPHWSHGNPIDILGDATPQRYARVTDCCFETENIDGMLVIVNPQAMTHPTGVAEALRVDLKRKSYPVVTAMMGGMDVEEGREILNNHGIPTYDTPERAVRSFAVLCDYACNLELIQQIPAKSIREVAADTDKARDLIHNALDGNNGFLTEVESKRLLSFYGIPVNRTEAAGSVNQAVKLADDMGYPLVMKILSPDIAHKTEANGVRTDLKNRRDVQAAFEQMMEASRSYRPEADIRGVSLQPMLTNTHVEVLIGAKKDDHFGPVILFGLGGIFAEVVGDRNIAFPPLNRTLAQRLMEKTKVYELLKGYRNIPAADVDAFHQMLGCLSHLLVDFPEISELDMNPVLVKDGKPVAVDARVALRSSEIRPPRHLVISPYPEQYKTRETTGSGVHLLIRPIKPEDASMLLNFFDNLSSESRYHRFFSPVKTLSRDMLIRLTQIDYDRHIALVAIAEEHGQEKMLGVARLIIGPDPNNAEFSVVVGDPWQGKGIGRKLLERCLDAGKDYGVGVVQGYVLGENRRMLDLARDVGFRVSQDPEAGMYHVSIEI